MDMTEETCCACGITFGVPLTFHNALRRTHQNFYCPNGHQLHYPDKTDTEILREQLQSLEVKLIASRKELQTCQDKILKRCKRCGAMLPKTGKCSKCANRTTRV